jgi:hypothetical protein
LPGRTGRRSSIIGDGELIETRIITAGALHFDPPGITLEFERIYG